MIKNLSIAIFIKASMMGAESYLSTDIVLRGSIDQFAKMRSQLNTSRSPHDEVQKTFEWMDGQIIPQLSLDSTKK